MPRLAIFCRTVTIFSKDGGIDESAYREFLQRFIDTDTGVCLGTGGAGEGHSMTKDEIRRMYHVAVSACKGKVPVYGNPPEQLTARGMRDSALFAIECGVDVVNIYQPASWHGFRPTEAEQRAYFDNVLSTIRHPVALAPLPAIGEIPKPALLADICRRYPQVVAINLVAVGQNYFIDLKQQLPREIALNVTTRGSLEMFPLGAAGIIGSEMTMVPRTYRRYADLYSEGKLEEAARAYSDILRILQYISPWNHTNARCLKMFIKAFKLYLDSV